MGRLTKCRWMKAAIVGDILLAAFFCLRERILSKVVPHALGLLLLYGKRICFLFFFYCSNLQTWQLYRNNLTSISPASDGQGRTWDAVPNVQVQGI